MAYATVQDVLDRWISSVMPPDNAVIEKYVDDASALLDADRELVNLAERTKNDDVLSHKVRMVVSRMVLRCLTNPDNIRATNETSGPFTGSITYATETLGGLYVSDSDRDLLKDAIRPAKVSMAAPLVDGCAVFGANLETPL